LWFFCDLEVNNFIPAILNDLVHRNLISFAPPKSIKLIEILKFFIYNGFVNLAYYYYYKVIKFNNN
jgi:hypothetical protein